MLDGILFQCRWTLFHDDIGIGVVADDRVETLAVVAVVAVVVDDDW